MNVTSNSSRTFNYVFSDWLLLINPVTFISDYPPEIQEIYYKSTK